MGEGAWVLGVFKRRKVDDGSVDGSREAQNAELEGALSSACLPEALQT